MNVYHLIQKQYQMLEMPKQAKKGTSGLIGLLTFGEFGETWGIYCRTKGFILALPLLMFIRIFD
jgi:hypothetical protein